MLRNFLILSILVILICPAGALAAGGSPLVLSYAGGTGTGNSDSKFVENVWSYTYQYHVLVLTGDTPQGRLFSQLQFEERDRFSGLAYAKLALSGSTYSVDFGDNVINFSDITLNGVGYQGAAITLKPSSSYNFTVVGGSKGEGLWGADVRRDSREKDTFTGIRANIYPVSGLGLNATYLTSPIGIQVLGYGGEYLWNDIKLNSEYGSGNDGKAYRGEIKYQNGFLSLGTIYRDVDTTYAVPMDYLSYKGAKGTYTTLGIRPSNDLSINVQSDSYIDRLNSDPEMTINDNRGDVMYNMPTGTSIGYSGWKNDRSAQERGGITEGEMMYITQQFYLFTRNAIYYRLQPTWFTSLTTSEESYEEEKNIAGINIALFDFMHLNYEIENTTKLFTNTDITINPTAMTARLDLFETPIFGLPLYLSSSANYRRDMADSGETSLESTALYEDVTLRYKPSSDFSCYITGKFYNATAPDAARATREQKDLSFGLNYTFNTLVFLK